MVGTMSFILGTAIGFLIPNFFLSGTDEVGDMKKYLGWIVLIEFGLVVICNIPAYFLFSEKP